MSRGMVPSVFRRCVYTRADTGRIRPERLFQTELMLARSLILRRRGDRPPPMRCTRMCAGLSRERSQPQECPAVVGEDSAGVPSARHVLHGSVCGVRRCDSCRAAPHEQQASSQNQSHRALQQHHTAMGFASGARRTIVFQEARQSLAPSNYSSVTISPKP